MTLSPGERGVQVGTEPLAGIMSHLIFGSCPLEGGSPAPGAPGLGVLAFLCNPC